MSRYVRVVVVALVLALLLGALLTTVASAWGPNYGNGGRYGNYGYNNCCYPSYNYCYYPSYNNCYYPTYNYCYYPTYNYCYNPCYYGYGVSYSGYGRGWGY